jgi:hypothetical protein
MGMKQEEQELTAARVARNDARFRESNEAIERTAERFGFEGLIPFICECADRTCTDLVRVSLAEYEQVRANPTWFINAPGHQVNAQGWAVPVAENERFLTVEKIGRAGEIAEDLDPRAGEEA